jgi:N-acyl-phosphatidylethanolamine-hydrolysing phospholipase D
LRFSKDKLNVILHRMASPFNNPWPHAEHGLLDILKWKLGLLHPRESPVMPGAPDQPAGWQRVSRGQIAAPPAAGWRAVWLGHASFLLQGDGISLLVDPIFSRSCGPLPLLGLRRLVAPPCQVEDLPAITAVLLTHSHYDHLDLPTLRQLGPDVPLIVADGHAAWLRRAGFRHVTELPWFDSAELAPGIRVTATPAQHFTARTLCDRNRGHWCGWLVESNSATLWHAGDSGLCDAFRAIGERFGPIDFGMIPIGAYQPRQIMRPLHMNPEEAVTAFQQSRCRRAAAMHWGTFRLTDEPLGEAPLRLARALLDAKLPASAFTCENIGHLWEIHHLPNPLI